MLSLNSTQKIYLEVEPVDIRKQFNRPCAMSTERLSENPFHGAMFCFTNKQKEGVKIFFWDG